MQVGTVMASDVATHGRMDAKFCLKYGENKPLIEEILNTFTTVEMLEFAKVLPYDRRAIDVILPSAVIPLSPERAFEQLSRRSGARPRDLALYVALAGRFSVAKRLEELVDLAKQ